jgi:hypothetical protein
MMPLFSSSSCRIPPTPAAKNGPVRQHFKVGRRRKIDGFSDMPASIFPSIQPNGPQFPAAAQIPALMQ